MQTTQTPASSSVPAAQHTVKNVEDALSADATGEIPEVGELGLEDIIDDGSSTQIMMRGELDLKNVVKVEASSPSPLDALAMTIPAKGNTLTSAKIDPSIIPASAAKKPPLPPMKVITVAPPAPEPVAAPTPAPAPAAAAAAAAAPPTVATMLSAQSPVAPSPKIPKPANTAPIVDLDSDDLIEQQTRIMERTQPFDRNRLFGAPRSNEPAAAAEGVSTPKNEKSTTQQSPWRPSPVPRELTAPASALPQTRQGGFAAPSQRPQTPSFTPAPLPSVVIAEPPQTHHRPASIAPLAIDLTPVHIPPMARVPEATQKLPAMRVMPRANNKLNIIAGAIAGGVAICAAAIIGVVSLSSDDGGSASTSTSKTQPTVAAKPREAQQGSARSAVIETPETTPARAASPLAARDEDGIPLSSPNALPSAPGAKGFAAQDDRNEPAPTPRMSTGSSNTSAAKKPATVAAKAAPESAPAAQPATPPAAAPAPAPAPTPRPAAATSTTGTIEVPANMMTVMVDGDYRRVQGGRIVVSCGKHRVNAGRGMRDVDVPCGGSVSAQ